MQICRGVQHMHTQSPPIAHRDIKIENVLIDARGTLKLCDFGSATTRAKVYQTSKEIVEEEELIGKYSTAMYRAPEMSDLYRRVLVNEKVDIWALGATLFTMAFFTQPFQDGGNLQILSGSYDVPEGHGFSNYLTALIRRLLTVDPIKRPDIGQVLALCAQWHRWLKGGGVAKPAPVAAPTRATSGGAAAPAASGPATAVTEPTQLHRHRSADEAASRTSAPLEAQSAKAAKKSSKLPKEKKIRSVAPPKEDADDSWADFGGFAAAAPASAPAVTATPVRSVSASAAAADSSSDCSSTDDEDDDAQPRGRPRAPSSYAKPPSKAKAIRSSPSAPAAPAAAASAAAAAVSPKTAMLFDFDFAPPAPAHAASASPAAADDDDWAAFDSAAPPARQQQQQQQFQSSPSPAPAIAAFDFDFSGLSPPPPSGTAAAAASAASPNSAHGRRSKKDDTIDIGRLNIRGHTHS